MSPSLVTTLMPPEVVTFIEFGSILNIEMPSVPNLSVYFLIALSRLSAWYSEPSLAPSPGADVTFLETLLRRSTARDQANSACGDGERRNRARRRGNRCMVGLPS